MVCREWNKILGKLFFGTVMVSRDVLHQLVDILQYSFEENIPFILTKDTLKVSSNTKRLDCFVEVDLPAETDGVEEGTTYYFLMSTRSLLKNLDLDDRNHISFHFLKSGRIRLQKEICSMSRHGYTSKVHRTGWDYKDFWISTAKPEYNLEVETNAEMFQGLGFMTDFISHIWMVVNLAHNYHGQDILVVSWRPQEEEEEDEPYYNVYVPRMADFFFKKKEQEQEEDGGMTRWEPAQNFNSDDYNRNPQRIVEGILVCKTYCRESIRDSLRVLNPSHRITICINTEQSINTALTIKYPIGWGKDRSLIHWIIK
jgi:hypothetical protein